MGICSEWGYDVAGLRESQVEPRDVNSAALATMAGIAHHPSRLDELPVPPSSPHTLPPRFFTPPGADRDTYYVEMIQPNNSTRIRHEVAEHVPGRRRTSRRVTGSSDMTWRKGLCSERVFRGLWIHSQSPERDAQACFEEFLSEPPSLGP